MNHSEQDATKPEDTDELPVRDRPSFASRWLRKLKLATLTIVAAYLIIVTVLVINEPHLVYPGSKFPQGE